MSYTHDLWTGYQAGWKHLFTLRSLGVILADSAFYVVLLVLLAAGSGVMKTLGAGVVPTDTQQASVFLAEAMAVFVLIAVVAWLAWTASRAIVWQVLSRTRFSVKTWLRFAGFCVVWSVILALPLWFLIRMVMSYAKSTGYPPTWLITLHYIFFALAFYIGYVAYYEFVKRPAVFMPIKDGVVRAVMSAKEIGVPFVQIALTFVVLGLASSKLLGSLPTTAQQVASYLLFFGAFTWAKVYFYDVLDMKAEHQARASHLQSTAASALAKKAPSRRKTAKQKTSR